MSDIGHSGFLSSCLTDNSDLTHKFLMGSNTKSVYTNLSVKQQQQSQGFCNEDLQVTNMKLEQKIALLEKEKTEMIEREINLKKINQQIMDAFDTIGNQPTNSTNKEIQILETKHQKEIQTAKEKYENLFNQFETEKKKFSNKVSYLENESQSQKLLIESLKTEIQKNIHLLDLSNSKYDTLVKSAGSEKKFLQEEIENKWKRKVEDLEKQNEKDKIEFNNQRELMMKELQNNLENLKILHEHDKHLLWTKVSGLQNEKNVIQVSCEQNQELYNELKKRHKEDRDSFLKEIDGLKYKINSLEQENLKISHYEMLQQQHENQLKQKELVFEEERKKYLYKIKELNLQIKKMEQIEKNLSVLIKEKDFLIEDNKKEHQKKLFLEKKKSSNLQEAANKIKEDYTKKNAFVIQEILTKEEHIKKLNKEIMKQGVSMSKMNLSKTNMTTWLDPTTTYQTDTCRLNSQNNQPLINSILNQDTIPDMNLLSNNVPQLTNNNTFLQEFAMCFGSPKNLIGQSSQQIDDKYFKLIQYQQQMMQLNSSVQNGKAQKNNNQSNYTPHLIKQESSPLLLNTTIETIHGNSPPPRQIDSRLEQIKNEDKIQETQNESEDHSFDNYAMDEDFISKQQQIYGSLIFNSKPASLGYVGQINKCNSQQYCVSEYNSAPNSFRQAFSQHNTNNPDIHQQSISTHTKSISKPTTPCQRQSNPSVIKKKQDILQQQQQKENDKTPNTSIYLKERKSANSGSKTPLLSSYKKEPALLKKQNEQQQSQFNYERIQSPKQNTKVNANYYTSNYNSNSNNNSKSNLQGYEYRQEQSMINSDAKRSSYSTHTSSANNNLSYQNKLRNKQPSVHRTSISVLESKKQSLSITDKF